MKKRGLLLVLSITFIFISTFSLTSAETIKDISAFPLTNPFRILFDMIADLQHKVFSLFNITSNLQTQIENISSIPGEKGDMGPQGIAGTNGTNGIDGLNGADGTGFYINFSTDSSCGNGGRTYYGYNVVNGIYTLNWTDEICNGMNGVQGIPGTNGIDGVNGTQGIQGETGPQGQQGIQGIPGPTKNLTTMYLGGYGTTLACCPAGYVRTGCTEWIRGLGQGVEPTDNECCQGSGWTWAICLKYSN